MVAEHLVGGATRVIVGRNLLNPQMVLPERDRSLVAIVSQPTTIAIAETLSAAMVREGIRSETRVLPDGEAAKTLDVIADLYTWFSELGVSRSDTMVAIGGGALTDAAGFAAATYLRGIETVYVTTTLLGAVDASIGGKTGVNLGAKNLIGSFRHPARVVADVDLLDALPDPLKRSGMSEALKAGIVGDEALVALLERDRLAADLEEVVSRSVAVKAAIVGRDFEEAGERAHLNYGHTIGHAIEVVAPMPHGEAVAVGMVAAGRASGIEVGFAEEDRQLAAIAGLGLPTSAPGLDGTAVRDLLAVDKKRDASGLRMVLLRAIGTPVVGRVGSATVEAALTAVDIS